MSSSQSQLTSRYSQLPPKTSNGEVNNPNLALLVTSLAENASLAMAPLYSLHAALIGAYGAHSQQVQVFAKVKDGIRQEWETWLSFLRRSMAYSRNYIALCNSLQSDGRGLAATMVVSDAAQLLNEAITCQKLYLRTVERFTALSQTYDPPPHKRPRHHKHVHHLPVILRAFSSSQASLDSCSRSLEGIINFWRDHSSFVSSLSTSQSNLQRLVQSRGQKAQNDVWIHNHNSLRRALSDITAYCDALTVAPLGSTKRGRLRERVDIGAELNVQQPAKIQEAGYFEVMTAPKQFDVAGLVKASSRVRTRFQTILQRTTEHDVDFLSELRQQAKNYMLSENAVHQIAEKGAGFYAEACKLPAESNNKSSLPNPLKTRATEVRLAIQSLLNHYDGILDRLSTHSSGGSNGGRDAKIFSIVPVLVADLRDLIDKLEDLDHFWFGLMAGVDYIIAHGFVADDVGKIKKSGVSTGE
ncbi:hypothetical protein ONZ45_g4266 [Pleurotus djamor]|nr:hypothetical protein ONZ45_g4266 [Pleurotus djamor]